MEFDDDNDMTGDIGDMTDDAGSDDAGVDIAVDTGDDEDDITAADMADMAPDEAGEDQSLDVPADLQNEVESFESWSQEIHEAAPELTEETLAALWEAPENRSYAETELVDTALHPEYEAQRSILTDAETGQAVRDAENNFVDCPRNTKGSQRPDGMMVDDTGVHLREAKNYNDLNNLKQNIKHQTEDRRAAFGDDVNLTYVVSPNFSIAEAEKLQNYVENKLGVNLEWQLK